MFSIVNGYCQQKSFRVDVVGKGQPVILIAGYAQSGDIWKATVDKLKENYQLHIITIAGYAGVPAINPPVLNTVKNDLLQYIKQNNLQKPILIGDDVGSLVSFWLAADAPNKFSKILCVVDERFIAAMQKTQGSAMQPKNILPIVRDSAQAKTLANWFVQSDVNTLKSTYAEMHSTGFENRLQKIDVPVLIIAGVYSTKDATLKMLNKEYGSLPNKKFVITPTKYFIIYDDPLWFQEQVKNFLANGLRD